MHIHGRLDYIRLHHREGSNVFDATRRCTLHVMCTDWWLAMLGSEGVHEREREREREREPSLTHSWWGHLRYQWFQVVLQYLEHRVTARAPPDNNRVVMWSNPCSHVINHTKILASCIHPCERERGRESQSHTIHAQCDTEVSSRYRATRLLLTASL